MGRLPDPAGSLGTPLSLITQLHPLPPRIPGSQAWLDTVGAGPTPPALVTARKPVLGSRCQQGGAGLLLDEQRPSSGSGPRYPALNEPGGGDRLKAKRTHPSL